MLIIQSEQCLHAGVVYVAGDVLADQWAAVRPTLASFRPMSWTPAAGVDWLWRGWGGEGYSGLPMADTEMGPDQHGCFSPAEPPATPYRPPQENTPLLPNPQAFPTEP